MREKYINAIFLAHCIGFGLTPYFLGPAAEFGYREAATETDIERFKLRRHGESGRLLRREQKNNQPYFYGSITSLHPSMNFRLTEYAVANGPKGQKLIDSVFRLAHTAAYAAACTSGTEVAKGAGGKDVMPGRPLFACFTHPVNHDGTPGRHSHRVSAAMAADPNGNPRVIRNNEVLYAQDRAYNLAFQAAFAHYAKLALGMKHVAFNGTHAVDKTVDPITCREIGSGQRQAKILAWMAKRNWDPITSGTLIPIMATRDKETKLYTLQDRLAVWGPLVEKAISETKLYTLQDRLAVWGPLVEKAIAGYEQRSGRKWERVPGPARGQEAEAAGAAVSAVIQEGKKPEPPRVEEPKQAAKINLNTYQQPKAQEAKAEPKQEQKQKAENKAEATQGAKPEAEPKKTRADQRKEIERREYIEGLDRGFVRNLRREVSARLKVFKLLREKRATPERKTAKEKGVIAIHSRQKLEELIFDLSKRPRWYARQRAHAVAKRNFLRMNPDRLAVLARKTFLEARRPALKLTSADRIKISKEVAATLTTKELRTILRARKGTGARVFIPGTKKEIFRAAAQQQRRRRSERGQGLSH